MVACSRLTELSVIYPYPYDTFQETDKGILFDPAGRARSAVSELIVACKALPDFNTLQIVRLPIRPPSPICNCDGPCEYFHPRIPLEQWERILGEQMKYLEEWAIDCLEREGRKGTTLRTIQFGYSYHPRQSPAKVKECEM